MAGHEENYRVAYESASAELREISEALEQLRIRKDHIEKLVGVLGPLVEVEEEKEPASLQPEKSSSGEPAVAAAAQSTSEEAGERGPDPFQRRIDHVLGIGAGIRDVRKYSRQF